jgi:uncharacterized protein YigA (DUF484 family)
MPETMNPPLDSNLVAHYLVDHPEFFQEHGALLAQVQLASPVSGRAISLQERQMEVMRSKYKALELRLAEFIRTAIDNDNLNNKFQEWTCSLLLARNDVDLPHILIDGLRSHFGVPHATLRLWRVAPEYSHTWFVNGVSEDARIFANSLSTPYCGVNNDFEAIGWLEEEHDVKSVAILPLRFKSAREAFGLLVLGSPDPERFTSNMALDFLTRIADTSSAAVACLLD